MRKTIMRFFMIAAFSMALIFGGLMSAQTAKAAAALDLNDDASIEAFLSAAPTVTSDTWTPGSKGTGLEAGRKITLDHPAYSITAEITEFDGERITVAGTLTHKAEEMQALGFYETGVDLWNIEYYLNGYKTVIPTFYGETETSDTTWDFEVSTYLEDESQYAFDKGANAIVFNVEVSANVEKTYGWAYHYFTYGHMDIVVPLKQPDSDLSQDIFTVAQKKFGAGPSYTLPDVEGVQESGTIVYYRKKGASAWKQKTFKNGKDISVTGLKAGTTYQYKMQNYVVQPFYSNPDKACTLKSDMSKVATLTTASSAAPKIQSISVVSATQKLESHDYPWYDDWGNVHHDYRNEYWTTVKLKVTLTKKPKNVAWICVRDPEVNDIKVKKTFTVTLAYKGKQKGKTKKLELVTFSNKCFKGMSPSNSKNFTIP